MGPPRLVVTTRPDQGRMARRGPMVNPARISPGSALPDQRRPNLRLQDQRRPNLRLQDGHWPQPSLLSSFRAASSCTSGAA